MTSEGGRRSSRLASPRCPPAGRDDTEAVLGAPAIGLTRRPDEGVLHLPGGQISVDSLLILVAVRRPDAGTTSLPKRVLHPGTQFSNFLPTGSSNHAAVTKPVCMCYQYSFFYVHWLFYGYACLLQVATASSWLVTTPRAILYVVL